MAAALRHVLTEPSVARVAGAHDALSALLAQEVGFDAVWASSFAISAARGLPDLSLLSMTDYLESARRMSEVCAVPVLADCDTGFGGNLNVAYLVRRYQAAGIGGVCIEDKVFPKRNSFIPGQALEDAASFAGKIATAKGAQRGGDFVVVARTEAAIAGFGVEEALRRCHRYVDAGADAVLMHSKSNKPCEVVDFIRHWAGRAPVVVVPTTYYSWSAREAQDAGAAMVIYANQSLRAAVRSMRDALRVILDTGSSEPIESEIAPMSDLFRLSGLDEWLALDQ